MKRRITFKEITLIVGVAVAIAAAMIFFGMTPDSTSMSNKTISTPSFKLPVHGMNFIESALDILF